MRLKLFLQASFWDLLLVVAASLGLSYAVLSGFESTLGLRAAWPLLLALIVPTALALFAGAWSKRAVPAAAVAVAVIGGVALAVAVAAMPEGVSVLADGAANDVEGNYAIFVAVVMAVTLAVFLLSRRPAGAVALLVAGVVVCGAVQFLFRQWLAEEGGALCFAVVLAATGAEVVFQRYRARAAAVDVLARPAFAMAFAQAVMLVILCVGAGAAVWGLVLAPLNLPAPTIKPFERTIARPVVEYSGIYDESLVENPDRESERTDEENETQDNAAGGSEATEDQSTAPDDPWTQFVQSVTVFNPDDWTEEFAPVSVEMAQLGFLVPLVVALLAVVAVLLARHSMRFVRLRRWQSLSPDERVVAAYGYLVGAFAKLGLAKPPQVTPLEFAFDQSRAMVPFTRGTGRTDFIEVTLIYQRAAYGAGAVTEEDWRQVERYYRAFFGNARAWVGPARWLKYFWTI